MLSNWFHGIKYLIVVQLVKKSPLFTEHEGSLPRAGQFESRALVNKVLDDLPQLL
jgi:hypothetical protein